MPTRHATAKNTSNRLTAEQPYSCGLRDLRNPVTLAARSKIWSRSYEEVHKHINNEPEGGQRSNNRM